MKSVVLPAYNNNLIRALLGIRIDDKDIPQPKPGQVQIKMEAAPYNPSDIAFLRGSYNVVKSLPCIPGFEGCGIITETGEGINDRFKGRRISFFVQDDGVGSWSEYVVANITDCIFLKDEMPMEQAACFAVNPFTAFGMYELAQQESCTAIIQNAASGQVSRFISELAQRDGLKVINIVRKAEQVEALKTAGEEVVLNSNDEQFEEELKKLAHEFTATMAYDAIGGKMTAQLINAMPADSEVIVYGGLSGMPIQGIDPMGVIFDRKIITGFNLMDWMDSLEDGEFETVSDYLQDLFIAEDLKTEIQGTYTYDDVVKGIRAYIGNMSAGKILITP